MDRQRHFDNLCETGETTIPLLLRAYDEVTTREPSLAQHLHLFLDMRTRHHQQLLRPYLVRIGHSLSGRQDWFNIAEAGAAMEALNISTYQTNIAFDGKCGVITAAQRNPQVVCAMLSLDTCVRLLSELGTKSGMREQAFRVTQRLMEVNNRIYTGQFLDMSAFHVRSGISALSPAEYMALYERRCSDLGGRLTALCLWTGAVFGGCDPAVERLIWDIGLAIGTTGQMVNDMADLIPAKRPAPFDKGYEPVFSDVAKCKVTYTMFEGLRRSGPDARADVVALLMRGEMPSPGEQRLIFDALFACGAFRETRVLVTRRYRSVRRMVRALPPVPARGLLALAVSTLRYNKYFARLREDSIRGGEHHGI